MENPRKVYTLSHVPQKDLLQVTTKSENRTLHASLKWVLFVAQCFAQMPVMGITRSNARYLRFTWKSWRVLYCLLNIIGGAFMSSVYIYRVITYGSNIYKTTDIIFNVCNFLTTIFFLKLAKEWPELMQKWSVMECAMRSYGWPKHLHTRITVMSIVVLGLAAIETVLSKASKIVLAAKCKTEGEGFAQHYFTVHAHYDVFQTVDYAFWKGILLLMENLIMTFAWTFTDLFIMLISTSLALRLKQVTDRLKLIEKTKTKDVAVWRETRVDYNRLSQLTKEVDNTLSYIIIMSFASNLFFILVQLFHSLRVKRDMLEKIYFFISFGLLIIRTICVSIYGAWIYDESKAPLPILNGISTNVYNVEVKRFTEQVKFDTISLTGKNFFYVTRGLVLSMAGAIVTYELVLIQFNENVLKESAFEAKNRTGIC